MKVAVLTVFYPEMIKYTNEYFKCIENQTFSNFTLVLVNDNCPMDVINQVKNFNIKYELLSSSDHPQINRINGIKHCYNKKYDIIISSDSDETMYSNRVEKIINYFVKNPKSEVVYNNSQATFQNKQFNLFYKKKLVLDDILDFNVLGFGAMNFTRKHIPFILNHQNLRVEVFDWWLALTYLTLNDSLDFLDDVKNHYRNHENNFTGPIFEINENQLQLGIKTKVNIYEELEKYCKKKNLLDKTLIFNRCLAEMKKVIEYIEINSMENYTKKVGEYFRDSRNIFWWEDVVSLKKLGIGE